MGVCACETCKEINTQVAAAVPSNVPAELLRRVASLEARVKALESGPVVHQGSRTVTVTVPGPVVYTPEDIDVGGYYADD